MAAASPTSTRVTAGTGATNTLVGAYNHNTTWTLLDTANSGTYSDSTGTVNFTGFSTLTADPYTTNTLTGETTASTWT